MRVIALLCLIFGLLAQGILDGQTFTHCVFGIFCGCTALGCGLAAARTKQNDKTRRWEGRIMAVLGMLLILFLLPQLPSTFRFQTEFNQIRELTKKMTSFNESLQPMPVC
jgi:hypothetical protein